MQNTLGLILEYCWWICVPTYINKFTTLTNARLVFYPLMLICLFFYPTSMGIGYTLSVHDTLWWCMYIYKYDVYIYIYIHMYTCYSTNIDIFQTTFYMGTGQIHWTLHLTGCWQLGAELFFFYQTGWNNWTLDLSHSKPPNTKYDIKNHS